MDAREYGTSVPPRTPARERCSLPRRLRLFAMLAWLCGGPAAHAQLSSSYVDDSVLARESLARLDDFTASGNLGEAARVMQQVLDSETDRVIESPGSPEVYISVRAAIHQTLLARPALLERYRQSEEPVAAAMLKEGRAAEVERSRFLTASGFDAAFLTAADHFEAARFDAAHLALAELALHPDAADAGRAARVANLAERIAAYIPRREVIASARQWSIKAGLPEPVITPIPWPERWSSTVSRDATRAGPAPKLDALIETPLQSAFLSGEAAAEYRAFSQHPREDNLTLLFPSWSLPAIVGDDVIVNDGRAVTALDRFTLAPRWRSDFSTIAIDDLEGGPSGIRGFVGSARIEDGCTVAAAGGVVVATTGILSQQLREGDNRLHAFDLASGRSLWSLAPRDVAESLRLAELRGSPVIDQSIAIQAFRRESAARRLLSTYLAGIDVWTGKTRWLRMIGSAGNIGSFSTRPSETPVVDRGVLYRVDEAGIVSAVETASGRIRWIRLLKGEPEFRQVISAPPWATQVPIVDGDSIIILDPTLKSITRFAMADGTVLATRETATLPAPVHYLLGVGEGSSRSLAIVTDNQIALLPIDSFHTARPTLIPSVPDPGFRGRVAVMGSTLAAPVSGGIYSVSLGKPGEPSIKSLSTTGNFVAAGSNLLLTDTWRVHSYLSWSDASALLEARMSADPSDPRPALALGELAFRSQNVDRLLPALDHALAAMRKAPESDITRQTRARFFTSVLEMVRATTNPPPEGRNASATLKLKDLDTVDKLLDRLQYVSESSAENVEWRMARGALRQLQNNPADACVAYQGILEDRSLAQSVWRESSPPVPTRQVVIARLRDVLGKFGPESYGRFTQELAAELDRLGPDPRPDALLALAQRYPVAPQTPAMLLRAARTYTDQGQAPAAADALARASENAWWLVSIGISPREASLAEVVGAHARALAALGRPMTAAHILMRASKARPDLLPTAEGSPLNPTALAAELRAQSIATSRPSIVGSTPGTDIDVLLGWSLMPPVLDDSLSPPVSPEWVLMSNQAQKRFALMLDVGTGRLSPAWQRAFNEEPPTILRASTDALYVLWHDDTSIERIDPVTGDSLWRSQPLAQLLPSSPANGPRMFDTPLDGPVRSIDLLAAVSEKHLVLCQRDGAALAFETATGKVAWSANAPLTRVYDLVLTPASLVLSGAADPQVGPEVAASRRTAPAPVIAVIDPASGAPLFPPLQPASDVRWIRASRNMLVAALVNSITSLDLTTGKPLWDDIKTESTANLAEGWVFDDTLFVLTSQRDLMKLALRTGELAEVDPAVVDRIPESGAIFTGKLGNSIGFSTRQGVFMLSPQGALVGANTVPGRRNFMPAIASRDVIALVEQSTDELVDGRSAIRIMLTTADSAKLLRTLAVIVQVEPDVMSATFLDGKLILSTDAVTQVIPLPPDAKP
ncbi:MAG TPA: PQQ-binding-like beta-propeller repeat protein [Phycisphaerales bacterium]|nr:PQQ-binding-like beta-propeller repeat protein [Phycisphaerales bacterium]